MSHVICIRKGVMALAIISHFKASIGSPMVMLNYTPDNRGAEDRTPAAGLGLSSLLKTSQSSAA